MMLNLKPFLDAAQAASTEVLRVANEIETAFALGTEEGTQQAMDLKSALDDAETKAAAANELYLSMRKAASTGDAASKFVPVTEDRTPDDKKTITRAEFEAMDYQARHDYLKAGGAIVDEASE
jgi:hypothetical protein